MLSANALWKQEDQRKAQRLAATRVLLGQIFHKIKQQVVKAPDAPYIVYPVPSFVFGYPLYNVEEAVQYLYQTLLEQRYQVWVVEGPALFISWVKPSHQTGTGRAVNPKPPTNYRPFVYDESSLTYLREKMNG